MPAVGSNCMPERSNTGYNRVSRHPSFSKHNNNKLNYFNLLLAWRRMPGQDSVNRCSLTLFTNRASSTSISLHRRLKGVAVKKSKCWRLDHARNTEFFNLSAPVRLQDLIIILYFYSRKMNKRMINPVPAGAILTPFNPSG